MDDQLLARNAAELVQAGWGVLIRSAAPLGGGINSATALVRLGEERAVLKWVRGSGVSLAAGCDVARRLAQHGLLTGDPFATTAGGLIHTTADGAAALLRFAAGDALRPKDPEDQRDMARTLAAVHTAAPARRSGFFLNGATAGLVHDVEPWIRPSVDLVLKEYADLPDLNWSVLHADPFTGASSSTLDLGTALCLDLRYLAVAMSRVDEGGYEKNCEQASRQRHPPKWPRSTAINDTKDWLHQHGCGDEPPHRRRSQVPPPRTITRPRYVERCDQLALRIEHFELATLG